MSGPVRILHVIGVMNRGGAETMIMNLYRRVDRERVQFDFVENEGPRAAFDDEIEALGGRIYRCPRFAPGTLFAYPRWWKRFLREHGGEYAAVHGHIGSTAAIYLRRAKKAGLFTVAHSHSAGTGGAAYRLLSYPTRFIADYFFACSDPAGRARFGARMVKGENYRVLPNAIETERFSFQPAVREEVRRELGVSSGLLVGHVGRFTAEKNHAFLLEAFAALRAKAPESRLLLVGDGPLRAETEARARALGLSDAVVFTGVRADVDRLLQAMDVFVFPSVYEGLPVTLVEAQTAGLPCVISAAVPPESVLRPELVQTLPLSEPPERWAETAIEACRAERTDGSAAVAAAGFDVKKSAAWLQYFYLSLAEEA